MKHTAIVFSMCLLLSACVQTPNMKVVHHEQEVQSMPSHSAFHVDELVDIIMNIRQKHPGKSVQALHTMVREELERRSLLFGGNFTVQGLTIDNVRLSDPELVALISRIDLILPTADAYHRTLQEIKILFSHLSSLHNNMADAYRHALWNIALVHYAIEGGIDINLTKGLGWAKTFSDAHEEGSESPEIEKAMDLHNNRVGRLFMKNHYKEYTPIEDFFSDFRDQVNVHKVHGIDGINTMGENTLVYLEE